MNPAGMAGWLATGAGLLVKVVNPAVMSKALLAVAAVCALQLLWAGGGMLLGPGVEPVAPVASALVPAEVEFPQAITDEQDELVNRPLYWQGRQPVVEVAAPVAEVPSSDEVAANDPIQKVKLLGVIAGGERPGVIVRNGGQIQRVVRGEQISGWTLTLMNPEGVVVEKGENSFTLVLEHAYPQGTGGLLRGDRADADKPRREQQQRRRDKKANNS